MTRLYTNSDMVIKNL